MRLDLSRPTGTGTESAENRGALASLALSMLLSSLGTSSANVSLPTLAVAFGAPFQAVQWVVLAYLLAVTCLIVSVGRLGDRVGRKRLLMIGVGLFTLASVGCGLAPGLATLIGARGVQGLGAAVMMALTLAFVGDTVPKERIGRAMGLLGSMSAVGTALGPSLGGVLIAAFGWRAIFLVNLPGGLLTLWLVWRFLPRDRSTEAGGAKGFDLPGTLLLALSLAAYALAMTGGKGGFGGEALVLLTVAVAGLAGFVLVERRVRDPLIRMAMFRDADLSASLGMSLVVATVMMATLVVGPFYLSGALGLDAARVGLVMSVGPVLSALTGVFAGRAVDRVGAGAAVVCGLAVMVLGAAGLVVLPGLLGYVGALMILTPGYQLFQAANNTAVLAGVDTDRRGLLSGLLNLARNLGLVTGASVMGAVFALAAGGGDIRGAAPAALRLGMQATFGLAAVLIFGALILAGLGVWRARRRLSVPVAGG